MPRSTRSCWFVCSLPSTAAAASCKVQPWLLGQSYVCLSWGKTPARPSKANATTRSHSRKLLWNRAALLPFNARSKFQPFSFIYFVLRKQVLYLKFEVNTTTCPSEPPEDHVHPTTVRSWFIDAMDLDPSRRWSHCRLAVRSCVSLTAMMPVLLIFCHFVSVALTASWPMQSQSRSRTLLPKSLVVARTRRPILCWYHAWPKPQLLVLRPCLPVASACPLGAIASTHTLLSRHMQIHCCQKNDANDYTTYTPCEMGNGLSCPDPYCGGWNCAPPRSGI